MGGKRKQQQAGEEGAPPSESGGPEGVAHRSNGGPSAETVSNGSLTALHRSRCWDWNPSAVVAISACPEAPLAVVGLESGDLELWDLSFMTCLQRVVGFGMEITALAWAKDSLTGAWRTFAAALDGSLAEISWRQGRIIASTDSGAGAVWSLAAQPVSTVRAGFSHALVAGCDDGSVRVFNVEGGEPGLVYERTLARLQGRVLAVTWHPSASAVVAGGADGCIHALDPVTGIESMRITASVSTTQPVCVWRLLVLADDTIVSGDSAGAVQFWEGKHGTLLHRFTFHAADIMALAASSDGNQVWASGIDARVAMFERSAPGGRSQEAGSSSHVDVTPVWVYTDYKRPHTHDVRALEVVQISPGRAVLLSGSLDAQLMLYPVSAFLKVHAARITKCPQRPVCRVAASTTNTTPGSAAAAAASTSTHSAGSARLLNAQQDTIDVWQLGAAIESQVEGSRHGSPQAGEALDLVAGPRHLARIKCKAGRVGHADISPDGAFLACTSGSDRVVRVYHLKVGRGSNAVVTRVHVSPEAQGATCLALSNTHLFVAQHSGKVQVFSLPAESAEAVSSADESAEQQRLEAALVGEVNVWDVPRQPGHTQSKQQQGNKHGTSWHHFLPSVTCMCASTTGGLLAVGGPTGVVVLKLSSGGAQPGMALVQMGKPLRMPHAAPLTAMSFSQDANLLAITLASGNLVVMDVHAWRPTPWSVENDTAVAARLEQLPGSPQGVCFSPQAASTQLLVHSAGGFCVLDVAAPISQDAATHKRRRGPQKPATGPTQTAGAGPVTEISHTGKSSKGDRPGQAGSNGHTVLLPYPVALVDYLNEGEVLLLEKPWEEVLALMPPPLHRERYGA